mmetsp:Transcript_96652/g.249890  ORF Transcript_96652/g.249890 Transcript_96652/m.249890 type:complete len:606 (-) Transcript_96652:264-2081(-)
MTFSSNAMASSQRQGTHFLQPVSLLDDVHEPAILIDVNAPKCPIVGVSAGWLELTGCDKRTFIGEGVDRLTLDVPTALRSKSSALDQHDFLLQCSNNNTDVMSEMRFVQQAVRKDGSMYTMMGFYGLCVLRRKRYVLGCIQHLGENFARLTMKQLNETEEAMRVRFRQLRCDLRKELVAQRAFKFASGSSTASFGSDPTTSEDSTTTTCQESEEREPVMPQVNLKCNGWALRREKILAVSPSEPFTFYHERLQHHCVLRNSCRTAERREANELANNCCMVFSNRPLVFSKVGLTFRVRVDKVAEFRGLPFLGITRREPEDKRCLYPEVVKGLGASAMVGGMQEAHVRDKEEHFQIGFKPPPREEVQSWQTWSKSSPAPSVCEGDVLTFIYTWSGRMQLLKSKEDSHERQLIMDIDTERPLDTGCVHYAMADVCFSAAALTVLADEHEPELAPGAEPAPCAEPAEPLAADCHLVQSWLKDARNNNMCQRTRTMGSLPTCVPSVNDDNLIEGTETGYDMGTSTLSSSPSVIPTKSTEKSPENTKSMEKSPENTAGLVVSLPSDSTDASALGHGRAWLPDRVLCAKWVAMAAVPVLVAGFAARRSLRR